jgi:hypothetical protein
MKTVQTLAPFLALAALSVAAPAGVIIGAAVDVAGSNSAFTLGYNYAGFTGYHLAGGCQVSPPTPCAFSYLGTLDTTGLLSVFW